MVIHTQEERLAVTDFRPWRGALGHALPVALVVLGLYAYWFGLADRYAVFLYEHLGATPFDAVTSSRYAMAGLVAGGVVLVLYTGCNLLAGGLARWRGVPYTPPAAWRVWLCCAPIVAAGVVAITMTLNAPTLPLGLALVGLALGLWPGVWAAGRPVALAWLVLDGAGLAPTLVLLRALELPAQGILTPGIAMGLAAGCLLGGAVWLLVVGWLRARRGQDAPSVAELLAAGATLAYPTSALLHYVFMVPAAYRYITTASNLFPDNPWLLASSWGSAGLLAWGATALRRASRYGSAPPSASGPSTRHARDGRCRWR
ncbi:MAG: hypothetical protein ACYC5M_02440 [Anaerolineae bacterium]